MNICEDGCRRHEKKAGMTMAEVAEKISISESYYSMIEAGERQKQMDITLAVKLADVLGLSIESVVAMEREDVSA